MSGRADVQIGGQLLLPSCYHPADTTEEKNIEMQARQAGRHSQHVHGPLHALQQARDQQAAVQYAMSNHQHLPCAGGNIMRACHPSRCTQQRCHRRAHLEQLGIRLELPRQVAARLAHRPGRQRRLGTARNVAAAVGVVSHCVAVECSLCIVQTAGEWARGVLSVWECMQGRGDAVQICRRSTSSTQPAPCLPGSSRPAPSHSPGCPEGRTAGRRLPAGAAPCGWPPAGRAGQRCAGCWGRSAQRRLLRGWRPL